MTKIAWETRSSFLALVKANDRRRPRVLVLSVGHRDGDQWMAAAVETVKLAKVATEGLAAVFKDHGHEVIGYFDGPTSAIAAAEAYGRAWAAGDAAAMIAACACSDINKLVEGG